MLVGELLQRISSREITEWMAFWQLEPFGADMNFLGHAITSTTVANVNRQKGQTAYDVEDFMPNFEGKKDAYRKLKSGGSSGFSALFGGWRGSYGDFRRIGRYGRFWSSSPGDLDRAWYLDASSGYEEAGMGSYRRILGFSVRCFKNN